MLALKEGIDKCDNSKIISSLIKLRKLSENSGIEKKTFLLLVDLLKAPNTKILNYALSLLANCCIHNNYRIMFKEAGGVSHLILILNTIDCDGIICRACRLVGNLALSSEIAKHLCENNVGISLLGILERHENLSMDALTMAFRATKKLWTVAEFKWKKIPDDLISLFNKSLDSDNNEFIKLVLRLLYLLTDIKSVRKNGQFKVSKELFLKLIKISKKSDLNYLSIACLSNLIIYQTSYVWNYLEGSEIAEIFIDYFQKEDVIKHDLFRAFHKLCAEGAIRNKVRLSGLLTKLINKCDSANQQKLLAVLYLFQYDQASMWICSQNPKFIAMLFNNIKIPTSVELLKIISRITPPVKELVINENLEMIINNKDCYSVLKNITKTNQFLKPLLLSGKVWQIEKVGCSMEELGSLVHTESLLIQLLCSKENKIKEDVSLAVPFLIKSDNFELLCKLLIQHEAMNVILKLFQENPFEEKVLASIIKLLHTFRQNYYKPECFFKDFGENFDSDGINLDYVNDDANVNMNLNLTKELVTFELDDGKYVTANKSLLCNHSPVINSMLNGHFIEANQEKVRLQKCSEKCFNFLIKLLLSEADLSTIETKVYLELLSVTDRFLLNDINTILTKNLKIDKTTCSLVYEWYRKAGYTKNNSIIRQKIYEFLFISSENLLLVLKNESCKSALVNDIYQYFSKVLKDFT